MHESSYRDSPLPRSVEEAYYRKCIDLKKRLEEVESSNDSARIRVMRLERAIAKLRTERAMLMDRLNRRQNRMRDDFSEKSTPPQSPQEHAPYRERSSHRPASSYESGSQLHGGGPDATRSSSLAQQPLFAGQPVLAPQPHFVTTNTPSHPLNVSQSAYGQQHSSSTLSAAGIPPSQLPKIQELPNGTSVMLVAPDEPKSAPWTINELDPRHHWNPHFDSMPLEAQELELFDNKYLPFDLYGTAILIAWNEQARKYVQIPPGQPGWQNPVVDSIRQDSAQFRSRMSSHGHRNGPTGYRVDHRDVAGEGDEYDRRYDKGEEHRAEGRRGSTNHGDGAFTTVNHRP